MRRVVLSACLFIVPFCGRLDAADWAERMFEVKTHDFGRVPFGAQAEYDFVVTNVNPFDVEIARTRVTCECTEPKVGKSLLKPGERTTITAHLATTKYNGRKGATITVTFGRPANVDVQLHVTSYIDKQVEIEPASIDLGAVEQGKGVEKEAAIRCSGKPAWRIVEVRSPDPRLAGAVVETGRGPQGVSYTLRAKLDGTAAGGHFKHVLRLVTNDAETPEIPVMVHGQVLSELEVSPSVLFMGVTAPAGTLNKVLVVRGKRPFKILSVRCDAAGFELAAKDGDQAKPLHLVPVTYTAAGQPGKVIGTIRIQTDLGPSPTEVPVQAIVGKAG